VVVTVGKRGPASEPTNLKLLRGVDKKNPQRVNHAEPKPATGEVVAPAWLSDRARQVWDRLAPDLKAKGVLTPWDADSFADLCSVIPINQDALANVEANGMSCVIPIRELSDGTVVYELRRNPAWQVVRESTAMIVTLGGRFGLNPSDRSQLKIGDGGRGAKGDDLLSG
jgi:P27 family predicted phage terminase small subunit